MIFEACKYIKWSVFIATFAFVFSCKSQFETENTDQLKQASKTANVDSQEALKILQSISTGSLSEYDYNYYTLLQIRARQGTGINIGSAQNDVEQVKKYFISIGDIEKTAYSFFVAGLVYYYQKDYTKSLYNFQVADDWAGRVGDTITDLNYYLIPYNVASMYLYNGQYLESLKYIEKARRYNSSNVKYKIYFDELASLNYKELKQVDSAWICINRAFRNVEQSNDTISRKRILYNICAILLGAESFDLAESKCKELLIIADGKDTFILGLANMLLADTYNKTGRADEANTHINKAKELLINADSRFKIYLFEVLYKTEQKAGNAAKAAQYKKEYESCIAEQERQRTAQKSKLEEELAAKSDDIYKIKHQERSAVKMYAKQRNILFVIAVVLFIIVALLSLLTWFAYNKRIVNKVINIQGESILASLNPASKNKNNAQFMIRVHEIIEKKLSDPEFIVDHIADEMHISRAIFYQRVRDASGGITPNGIVKLKRLKKAAEYLHEGGLRINEVCYKVGFNSPSYFAKCFSKQFGMRKLYF